MRSLFVICAAIAVSVVFSPAASATGPLRVSRILITKSAHTLDLYSKDVLVKRYRVALGPGGPGVKHREGDSVTPVGHYHIVQRTPSKYTKFMLIDYPNAEDRARFQLLKKSGELSANATIGGDVGIHGSPPQPEWKAVHKEYDWTLGCVAVNDDEIIEIAAQVADGTAVEIVD